MVYQAWTDPKRVMWFLNDTTATPRDPIVVNLRVGGAWKLKMVVNEHLEYFTGGIYRELVPGENLVFTWGATEVGQRLTSTTPKSAPSPR